MQRGMHESGGGSPATAPAKRLLIRQKREWGEILTGFETRNRFEICDEEGNVVGMAAEEKTGLGGVLLRNLFGRCRASRVHIYGPDEQEVGLGEKPFRFYFHRMEARDRGRGIGAIQRRFSILHRKFTVEDAQGREVLEIVSPFIRIWTFKVRRDGEDVALIRKKWGGLLKEAFTDADVFGMEYLVDDLDPDTRKLLLVATFLIDFTCFEGNAGSGGGFFRLFGD